ncbi:phosphoadenosine phosphosulfate reductase family protein [Dactylosporangium sp. CA-139066]|uniref:phosphoadenosine phosphosulfate reductase domain-containing protein n=1 Tax=Dactylosporangium sp. CA-139066 TaxID=3239930 RepID=UPI003D9472BB
MTTTTTPPTLHVVQYSGGITSWAAAQRVAAQHGTDHLVLLFADVRAEHPDLYRFLDDTTAQLGVPLTRVADGRTPFQLFRDIRYLGNSRVAPCTYWLKIVPCRRWLEANADPANTILYIGLDASTRDRRRAPGITAGWAPWTVRFPLLDEPHLTKTDQLNWARTLGIEPPELYKLGFDHNNCHGLCIRAGIGQWTHAARVFPEQFAAAAAAEAQLRADLGDVAILTEQRNRVRHRLPLTVLCQRITDAGAAA